MVTLRLQQIHVPPGQRILLEAISWHEFEAIVEELGEHRGTRIAYSKGILEIVSPLPEHEKAKVVISDLLKVLLDELDMPWESLGSTTFRREEMAAGIEPDDCFYIQHQAAMVGKDRIDLTVPTYPSRRRRNAVCGDEPNGRDCSSLAGLSTMGTGAYPAMMSQERGRRL